MPKETFFNLPEEKREKIMAEVVREFRDYRYDEASINRIVQRSGIAKGSFYQYFENKEDVYFYLLALIGEKKMENISPALKNPGSLDFFSLLKEIYRAGIEFGLNHPDYLEIGNKMMRETSGTIWPKILEKFGPQGQDAYLGILQRAQKNGEIRKDLDLRLLARMMISMQMTLMEHYFENHGDRGYSLDILEELDQFFVILKTGIAGGKP